MKYWTSAFLFIFFVTNIYGQELDEDQIYLADPTIFEDNGTFYLYGTKGDPRIEGEGFLVYKSKDLKHWEGPVGAQDGFALKKGEAYGTKGFWAPQIFKFKDMYYLAYTADENIAIAKSNSPLGPFENEMKPLDAQVKQIDPFVFFDHGKVYMYHVRLQEGNRIFVAEMSENLTEMKTETLQEAINAEAGWEDTQKVEWPVAEGPTVLKKDGLYYLIYSANDFRNPDYAVGYATSETPFGPWEKSTENPILQKESIGENGSGHGDVFTDGSGKMFYVFHTHFSDDNVHPRKAAIVELQFTNSEEGEILDVQKETFRFLKQH